MSRLYYEREIFVLLAPGILLLLIGFFVPIGYLCSLSFIVGNEGGKTLLGFSQYMRFLTDPYYWAVSERTLRLSLIITLFCLLLGFPLSYLMSRVSLRIRLWLTVLVILPLMTSVVIRTFGWLVLLGRGGPLTKTLSAFGWVKPDFTLMHTEAGIVVAMVQVLLPFMTLTILGVISRIDRSLEEASRTLGYGFYATLGKVVLPLCMPGIVSGSLLVFALSISSFITPTLVGGLRLPVLAGSIYQHMTATLDWSFAAAESVILLLAVLLFIIPYTFVMRQRRG
jgi:putative spermidine/putrescine transport system permease protein